MAPDAAENWSTVGTIIGFVAGGIILAFRELYKRSSREEPGELVVKNSVGAAFVDRSAASDLARIAMNTDKMVDMMTDRAAQAKEADLLRKLEEKLRHPKEEGH